MGRCRTFNRKMLWFGLLLAALLIAGCAGIEPYEPRDHREEGPEQGLITGPEGEFVIYRKADEPTTENKAGNKREQ